MKFGVDRLEQFITLIKGHQVREEDTKLFFFFFDTLRITIRSYN